MSGKGTARLHTDRKIDLPPETRRAFEAMRRIMGPDKMADVLHVAAPTIFQFEHGGRGRPESVAKMVAALDTYSARKGAA